MATRNFWIEAEVEGRKTPLAGGPRSKDGGMDILLTVCKDGGIREAVRIVCRSNGEKNTIMVFGPDRKQLYYREYKR